MDDGNVGSVLVTESVELVDAAASSRMGEFIREAHGELAVSVEGLH